MWNRLVSWLRGAPVGDEVDRRNAPTMQLLLILIGCAVPLNAAYYVFIVGLEFRPGWAVDLGTDVAISLMAWVSVALIRRGRFRLAIMLFLATTLASAGAAYATAGFQPSQTDKLPVLLLALGGLVLGRGALWTIFALLMAIFALGMLTDVMRAQQAGHGIGDVLSAGPPTIIGYFIIAIILDRTIAALRESLAESDARRRELQLEMAERERAQTQLIHAQKLEATGRLASGIAHDFGNILDVILGFARQRHDAEDLPDACHARDALADSLEGIETAARRGTAITRKLLGFSRADLLKPQTFDLGEAVADLQPMLRQLFPPSVRLSLDNGDRPLAVHIDRSELEMMLLNIAANARDAMPGGGRFEVRVFEADAMACISLADSGHGMDARLLRHIFEPFFTTKDASTGTGLGLSVIQDLVRAVGGDIGVESTPGAGSTFTVRLPLAASAPVSWIGATNTTAPDGPHL